MSKWSLLSLGTFLHDSVICIGRDTSILSTIWWEWQCLWKVWSEDLLLPLRVIFHCLNRHLHWLYTMADVGHWAFYPKEDLDKQVSRMCMDPSWVLGVCVQGPWNTVKTALCLGPRKSSYEKMLWSLTPKDLRWQQCKGGITKLPEWTTVWRNCSGLRACMAEHHPQTSEPTYLSCICGSLETPKASSLFQDGHWSTRRDSHPLESRISGTDRCS